MDKVHSDTHTHTHTLTNENTRFTNEGSSGNNNCYNEHTNAHPAHHILPWIQRNCTQRAKQTAKLPDGVKQLPGSPPGKRQTRHLPHHREKAPRRASKKARHACGAQKCNPAQAGRRASQSIKQRSPVQQAAVASGLWREKTDNHSKPGAWGEDYESLTNTSSEKEQEDEGPERSC